MKKEKFFSELGKIHFLASCYVSLFPYLDSGVRGEVIDIQLQNIRHFDHDEFWKSINSQNILKKQVSVDKYLRKKGSALLKDFMNLKLSVLTDTDLHLWFSTMVILYPFSENVDVFLKAVVRFFVQHVRCFSSLNYLQLVEFLACENMPDLLMSLSSQLGIPYDLPPELAIQIFDAKYAPHFMKIEQEYSKVLN